MSALSFNKNSLFFLPAYLLTSYLLINFLIVNHALADTVYKSVDKDGKTTYSSSPVKDSQVTVKVDIRPPPSENEIKAAQQRHQQNLSTDKLFEENRKKRSHSIAEEKHTKRKKQEMPESVTLEEGPYYGIPGQGILVLPKNPRITPHKKH